jgi:MYXO-CTERM domain-containing protein
MLFLAVAAQAAPIRCLTPHYLALRDAPYAPVNFRPADSGFVDSAIYPLRLHYRDPSEVDRVTNVLMPMAEDVWAVEIDQMGWPTPPTDNLVGGSDAYDIYFTEDETYRGAYTFGFGPDVIPNDNWYSNATYIAVDDRISDGEMEAFIAHEFNHALQWTIDGKERTLFVWEATAEAIADIVYDDIDYSYEVRSFQALPFMSLLHDSYNPDIYPYGYDGYFYEYGGLLFTTYLEEKYGTKDGTVLLKLWDDLAQPVSTDEPDFLDAIALVDPSVPSVAAVYADFAVWRMFTSTDDDGAHYEEAGLLGDYALVNAEATLALDEVDGWSGSPAIPPYDIGATYYRIDLGAGSEQAVHAVVTGDPGTQWGIAWAVWMTAGGPATTGSTWVADGQPLSADIPLSGGARAAIGVLNTGPAGLDPNDADPRQRSFTLDLSLVDAADPPGDTGTPPVDTDDPPADTDPPDDTDLPPADSDVGGEKGGCGCDTRGSMPLAALALLAVPAIRRRRIAR